MVYKPTQYCCNSGCTNCGFGVNKKCVKQFSDKQPCKPDYHINGFNKLGKKAFNAYNIDYGYFPEHLKCLCRTRGKDCKMKTAKSCNCSKECVKVSLMIQKELSENRSYMKVYNRYQDITYNTVDGWPPTTATVMGNSNVGRVNTLAENQQEVIARLERRLYRYKGRTYGHREYIDVTIVCDGEPKIVKKRVSCIPGAVRVS
jgi:hypothetical protein